MAMMDSTLTEVHDSDIVTAEDGTHVRVLQRSHFMFLATDGKIYRARTSTRLYVGDIGVSATDGVGTHDVFV